MKQSKQADIRSTKKKSFAEWRKASKIEKIYKIKGKWRKYALVAQSAGTNWVVLILVYVVIFGGFYMLFMRPQKKEQKRIQEMIAEMEVGDTVLTTSGFYGVIIDITDDDLIVEFGNNKNCRIPMQKAAIAQVEKASAE